MTLRFSAHFSIFDLVFFVLKSLLGIARQWSREKFASLTLKPRSHARILIHPYYSIQMWSLRQTLSFRNFFNEDPGHALTDHQRLQVDNYQPRIPRAPFLCECCYNAPQYGEHGEHCECSVATFYTIPSMAKGAEHSAPLKVKCHRLQHAVVRL